jgi:hypothetical protein
VSSGGHPNPQGRHGGSAGPRPVDATVWVPKLRRRSRRWSTRHGARAVESVSRRDLATFATSAWRSSESTATSRGLVGPASTWTHGLVIEIERNVSKRAASARGQ